MSPLVTRGAGLTGSHAPDLSEITLGLGYRPEVLSEQLVAATFQGHRDDGARRKPLGARSAADG